MNITVEQTLQMPNAVLFARELEAALRREEEKRRHFYEIIDENKKMEFINGEICFQSPVKIEHNSALVNLVSLLSPFVNAHSSGFLGVEKILVSLTRNDYEPDICFFGIEKSGEFRPKQMQFPAPDLAVEILSESTERNDREIKFLDYAAHGVSEYWIIDPNAESIEQYLLEDGEFRLHLKSNDGHIESLAVRGFRIPIRSVFDKTLNLETLKEMLG